MPEPIVSRSVQTGTERERIVTPLPIRAPSARRYSTYSGFPTKMTIGFAWSSTLTTQKRKYVMLQTGNSARLPATYEHPFGDDRESAQSQESDTAEQQRPQIDVHQTRTGGDPLVSARGDESGD
ncbi:hypothetical protein SHIRM173S_09423 [Streptomyces hirsutus]